MPIPVLHRVVGVLALTLASMACSTGPRPTPTASGAETRVGQALVDGVPVAYHVFGSGPVVIAHPGGPGGDWGSLRMPEVEKVATVVYIEPFGTGDSGRLADPNGYTIEAYVKAVEGVRASLGVDRVALLGHSPRTSCRTSNGSSMSRGSRTPRPALLPSPRRRPTRMPPPA
ncbi:MAG: alpha/beta hydrolase [Myxococcaceae bacterium]|nr:MAG: alpha/beta hydrolase [Myxococcaceae bacterium]